MKYEELNTKINSYTVPKVFFFYGEEKYMLENRINAIKKRLVPDDLAAFNFCVLEGKISADEVIEAAEQFPQGADRRMVLVRNSGLFSNAASKEFKAIKGFVADLPEYICLVFREDDFDKKREKNLAFVEQAGGGVVNFEFLTINKLEAWAEKRFDKAGKRINASDLSYLIRLTGRSMSNVAESCAKIVLYLGEERHRINRADIDAVVTVPPEIKVYDVFSKDIIGGSGGRAKEKLALLKKDNQSAVMVMSIITDQLYELLMCKLLKQDGLSAQEMLQYYDRKPPLFAVNNAIENSKRYSEKYLKRMVDRGLKYSMDMKTGKIEQWTAVEQFVSELIRRG
mgnify:CR=1 FL=1